MVHSSLPWLWAAIVCCAANAEPLDARTGTNRVILNASSLTTSLQQQDVSSSPTILTSSSSAPSTSACSSISITSFASISRSSSSTTPASSCPTCVWSPLAPPPRRPSLDPSTTPISKSDVGNGSYTSSLASSPTDQKSSGDVRSQSLSSKNLASPNVVTPSDGKEGGSATGAPLKPTGRPVGPGAPVSPPTAVGPVSVSSGFKTLSVPLPPSKANSSSVLSLLSAPVVPIIPTSQLNTSTTLLSSKYHNSTSTRSHSSLNHNTTTLSHTATSSHHTRTTKTTTSDHHHDHTSSTCTPYTAGETITIWSILPNTNTITLTLTANQPNTYTTIPEFTPPPPPCTPRPKEPYSTLPTSSLSLEQPHPPGPATSSTIAGFGESSLSIGPFVTPPAPSTEPVSTTLNFATPPVTTAIITSKNPVTKFTTVTAPTFPGGGHTQKQSIQVTPVMSCPACSWTPLPPPPRNTASATQPVVTPPPDTGSGANPGSGTSPSTVNVGGVTVVVGPSSVAIGGHTVAPLPPGSTSLVKEGGQTFTVNPSQVIGPGTVVAIPTSAGGGVFMQSPSPTVVDGVSVSLGNGVAVIGGSTFSIGAGAPQTTVVRNKETISIGPGGVGFADVTLTPPVVLPTNVVLFDGAVFSAVGESVAVFDGTSVTFTGGVPITTVFNGDTITIGPDGIIDGASTLGGSAHPTGTQLGIAGGIQVSEIGSTIAVIGGTTLTIGPDATAATSTIDGHTITATTSGLIIDGSTTLTFPFNPTTQEVTAGGITFSEIGSSLVDIGGTTYTIGPGATPTTDVYNGQTISLGPGGIGFATTTITSFTSSPTASASGKKKNGGAGLRPSFGIWGACIALGVVLLI